MQYMSFDLSYFSTVPGLLTTGGLILLIIGLVVFIISGKKKNTDAVQENVVPDKPNDQETSATPVVTTETTPVDATVTPQVTPEVVSTPEVTAPVDNTTTSDVTKVEDSTVPVEATVPQVEVPAPTVETVATPEVAAPAFVPVENPTVEEKKEEVVPSTDSTVSIYGGANPQVAVSQVEEPRKVYGGADPLENTGAIPRVETPAVVAPTIEEPKEETKPEVAVPAVEEKPSSAATPNTDVETLEF